MFFYGFVQLNVDGETGALRLLQSMKIYAVDVWYDGINDRRFGDKRHTTIYGFVFNSKQKEQTIDFINHIRQPSSDFLMRVSLSIVSVDIAYL